MDARGEDHRSWSPDHLNMLRALDDPAHFSEMPKSAGVESVETPPGQSFGTLDTPPTGPFQKIGGCPPPLTPDEQADVREAIDERAAIAEFDGGLSRAEAEAQAQHLVRVYRVRVAMGSDRPHKWAVMLIGPADDPRTIAERQFGAERVLDIVAQPPTGGGLSDG